MEVNPIRWQRTLLMLSAVLGVVMVVGAFVYGWFRPAGLVGNSAIVADRKLGTLYVAVDGRLHPALNLVSAQLIAGSPDVPTFVSPEEIARIPMGLPVGIIGAPVDKPMVQSPEIAQWAVCDSAPRSLGGSPVVTGIDGALTLGHDAVALADDQALLLSYRQRSYVVTNGTRMPVDLTDSAVTTALGVHGKTAIGMSRALFDALPAGGPLVVPVVPEAGTTAHVDVGPTTVVGAVVAGQDVASGADRFYVVLIDGVQPISPVVAAMLRQQNSYGLATPPHIPPDRLARIPVRHVLDVDYYPKSPVHVLDSDEQPVTCIAWQLGLRDRQARLTILSGRGLPIAPTQHERLVRLVTAGHGGVQADQVLLADGASTFVTTTGSALDSPARETLWLISATGTRYGVPFDQNSAAALGLQPAEARPAPWSMLQVWAGGPELSRTAALTVHDAMDGAAPMAVSTPPREGG